MKKEHDPAHLLWKIETGVRQHLISKLSSDRAKMVPMYEYSSNDEYYDEDEPLTVERKIIDRGVTFEPGDTDSRGACPR